MEKFIQEIKDSLSTDICTNIIQRFEHDERKVPGITFNKEDPDVKKTMDLHISSKEGWKDIDTILFKALEKGVQQYIEHLKINDTCFGDILIDTIDTGYQIQRYTKETGYYKWHHDFSTRMPRVRKLTYIWYLNDVIEGGETEFINGTKIRPETGKLMLFPSCWTFVHRGCMPISNDKYIATGWLYSKGIMED